jgi:hypothetical protein
MRRKPSSLFGGNALGQRSHDDIGAPAVGIRLELALQVGLRLSGEPRVAGRRATFAAHAVAARAEQQRRRKFIHASGPGDLR